MIWTDYEGLEYELLCYVKYDNLDEINLDLYTAAAIIFLLEIVYSSTGPGGV